MAKAKQPSVAQLQKKLRQAENLFKACEQQSEQRLQMIKSQEKSIIGLEDQIDKMVRDRDQAAHFIDAIKHAFLGHEASQCWEPDYEKHHTIQNFNVAVAHAGHRVGGVMDQPTEMPLKKSDSPHALFIGWALNCLRQVHNNVRNIGEEPCDTQCESPIAGVNRLRPH